MTQFVFIILLYWYHCGSLMVQSHFEVIEGEEATKTSMDYDSIQEYDELQVNKSKFSKENRYKFPCDFRSAYPPSVTYLLWLGNNKQFPRWVYDMVRSKYHDDSIEWRINELNKLYRKCDIITGGFPLSGIYIRHLLELINLQKRIDDHSLIQDINTKQELDYLKSVHLPKANNLTIRLHLNDEGEILRKVDPIGYLKALAMRSPSVRQILYRKYLSLLQNSPSLRKDQTLKDIIKQRNRNSNRLQRRNTTKRTSSNKVINTHGSQSQPIISVSNHKKINKIQNIIDLIEDRGLNISTGLRKELRHVCKDYLNNYLEETYNLTNILKRYLDKKQLIDDSKYKKLLDSDLDETFERIGTVVKENKNKEIDTFFSDDDDYKKKKEKKHGKLIISKEVIINKDINAGDTMYSKIKFKSSAEDENKARRKFNKLTEFLENTKFYKKIKKEFSDNHLLSKYDLTDVLENIEFEIPKQSKKDLIYLYGELLKMNQKAKLQEIFDEQNCNLCFPNMRYEGVIDMLTSLTLFNINNRRKKNRATLANVLENLGFNMSKSVRRKIDKLYFEKIKSNSNNSKRY